MNDRTPAEELEYKRKQNRKAQAIWRRKHPEEERRKHQEWYAKNREKALEYQRKYDAILSEKRKLTKKSRRMQKLQADEAREILLQVNRDFVDSLSSD